MDFTALEMHCNDPAVWSEIKHKSSAFHEKIISSSLKWFHVSGRSFLILIAMYVCENGLKIPHFHFSEEFSFYRSDFSFYRSDQGAMQTLTIE